MCNEKRREIRQCIPSNTIQKVRPLLHAKYKTVVQICGSSLQVPGQLITLVLGMAHTAVLRSGGIVQSATHVCACDRCIWLCPVPLAISCQLRSYHCYILSSSPVLAHLRVDFLFFFSIYESESTRSVDKYPGARASYCTAVDAFSPVIVSKRNSRLRSEIQGLPPVASADSSRKRS